MATPQLSWKRKAGDARDPHASALVDQMMDRYVRWREDAAAAESAYTHWRDALRSELGWRFATYVGMLDREEASARRYALAVASVESRRRGS